MTGTTSRSTAKVVNNPSSTTITSRSPRMLKDHAELIDEVVEGVMENVKADTDLLLESMSDDIHDLVEANVMSAVEQTVLAMEERDDDGD